MLKANALFDVVQGAALVDYDKLDLQRRTAELYYWSFGSPPDEIQPPYFIFEKVEVYGRVLDLEQGRIREIEGCRAPRYEYDFRNFRFGELLDVCEDEAYRLFIELWAGKVRAAMAAARARGDEGTVQCGDSMAPVDAIKGRRLALCLTPAGVAVFNVYWWIPNSAKWWAFDDNITVNPVILSCRELQPFMKPGPRRDDVLDQGRAKLP
jgi:hypothetical protein